MDFVEQAQANISEDLKEMVERIADARNDCKLVMISVQNVIDHGEPAAQVVVFRNRKPEDGLMVLKR